MGEKVLIINAIYEYIAMVYLSQSAGTVQAMELMMCSGGPVTAGLMQVVKVKVLYLGSTVV